MAQNEEASGLPPDDFDRLLDHLKQTRGFDFTGYKRSTVTRRTEKRLSAVGVERFADYIDYLEVHPEEFALLFDSLLINVTTFFRDPPAWQVLRDQVVPMIIE